MWAFSSPTWRYKYWPKPRDLHGRRKYQNPFSWWFSNCISGFTSRCQCLFAVVTDKNIAVNEEINCSYCLGPRVKSLPKAVNTWEHPLLWPGFAPSPFCKWQLSPRNCPLYPACPAPASNYFTVANYIEFSALFQFTCFLLLGQLSASFIFFQSFSSHYNHHTRTRQNVIFFN